jgi:hypothetical protein
MASIINAATSGGLITTADTSGILQLQTAGTTAVTVDASQRAAFVAGTAALPAITTTGDTNTGIFFPAADTIAFAEGGAEAMRIDSAGAVLAGTASSVGSSPTRFQSKGGAGGASPAAGYSIISGNDEVAGQFFITASSENSVQIAADPQNLRASSSLQFATDGSERARIDSSGRLIVGGSNVNGRIQSLTPASYTESSFRADSATNASTNWNHFYGTSSSNSVANIIIYGNGNIQNANNSYGSLSDAKLKENIVDATPKLDKLLQVRIRNYNLKGAYEQHKQIGVVAQELEQVFPSMIDESPDRDAEGNDLGTTTKSVKYSVFVPMLIKAIQEQQALITQLQADVAALKGAQA